MNRSVCLSIRFFLSLGFKKNQKFKNDYFDEARSLVVKLEAGSLESMAADFLDTFGTKTASMTCMIPLEVLMSAVMTLAWLTCNSFDLTASLSDPPLMG